jgi:hypothetical protein
MHPILLYLLKMLLCSSILYGYYRIALYNERFHQWNRFYLLAALLVSVVMPLVKIPIYASNQSSVIVTIVDTLNPVRTLERNTQQIIFHETRAEYIIGILILMISTVLLVKFTIGLISIIRNYKAGSKTTIGKVLIIHTDHKAAPYSFFNWLFWRKSIDLHSPQSQRMLQHELAHIRQHHTIDKIFIELIIILFWMNPIFWLIRKEVYVIHEFLADQKAIKENNSSALAEMILQSLNLQTAAPLLTNPFFTSQIKRRIIMITTSTKPVYSYFRRINGLCCIVLTSILLVVTFQNTQAQAKSNLPTTYGGKKIKEIDIDRTKGMVRLTLENNETIEKTIKQADEEKILSEKILYPQKRNEPSDEEKQKATELMNKSKVRIENLPAQEKEAFLMATTTKNEVIVLGTQYGMSAGVNGMLMPVNGNFGINTEFKEIKAGANSEKTIYIFDGKIVKPEAIATLTKKIQDYNIQMYNGDQAEVLYGKIARYGVVTILPADSKNYTPIKTDEKQGGDKLNIKFDLEKSKASNGKYPDLKALAKDALIVFNGEEINKEKLVEIDVESIESVELIQGELLVKQYGDKAKNGVMKITSKNTPSINQ